MTDATETKTETATFAAGCFWGVEVEFANTPGVLATRVGYTGGQMPSPTYRDVCSHTTGHAEAVEVKFDPAQISYQELVQKFFELHDPTQVNRQGPDIGDNYRSEIFTHNDEQRSVAEATIRKLTERGAFKKPIATLVEPASEFWEAEEYHQRYLEKRGMASCHVPSAAR